LGGDTGRVRWKSRLKREEECDSASHWLGEVFARFTKKKTARGGIQTLEIVKRHPRQSETNAILEAAIKGATHESIEIKVRGTIGF